MSAIDEVTARPTAWTEARVADVAHPTPGTVRLRLEPADLTLQRCKPVVRLIHGLVPRK